MKPSHALLLTLALLARAARARAKQPTCRPVAECLPRLQAGQKCPLFRMLPGTYADPPGARGFVVTTLRNGVHHYSDDAYHSLIVFSRRARTLVVIDFPRSPNSFAPDGSYRLLSALHGILANSTLDAVHMVYGHRHLDHIGGGAFFRAWLSERFPNAALSVWGTRETRRALRSRGDGIPAPGELVLPTRARTLRIDARLSVRLMVVGGHTRSDLLAHVRPQPRQNDGVVHVADLVAAGEAPFIHFVFAMDVGDFLAAHDKLLRLDFRHLSTGHGKLGTKRDVWVSRAYTQFVLAAIQRAALSVSDASVGAIVSRVADPGDRAFRNGAWALKQIIDLQVKACVIDVVREWACRLSVVDVFAEGHCLVAALYNLGDL